MTENDNTNTNKPTERLLERILSRDNLNKAYQKVKRNKGAGGVDGMEVDELLRTFKDTPGGNSNILTDRKLQTIPS